MKQTYLLFNILVLTIIGCNSNNENSSKILLECGTWIYSDFSEIKNGNYNEFNLLQLRKNGEYRIIIKSKTGFPDSLNIRSSIDSGFWIKHSDSISFINHMSKPIYSKFKLNSFGIFSLNLFPNKQFISSDSFFITFSSIVDKNVKIVAGDMFGYAASPSEFYLSMELLNDFGDSLKFKDLIKSQNPALRVMGAILSLKYGVNKEIVEKLTNDTTTISFCSVGCDVQNRAVGEIIKDAYRDPDFLRQRK